MNSTVVGHFRDADAAQAAIQELEHNGFTSDEMSYMAHDGSGKFAEDAQQWADTVQSGGALVVIRVSDETVQRAVAILKAYNPEAVARHEAAVRETGVEFDPSDPHTDAPNFGDEGGSSQWGQTVLRADESEPASRTLSRDAARRKLD